MLLSIFTVMSGTVVAQGLALLLLPVISRVYEPKEFGEYQVLTSAVLVLLPLAALKMELAVLRLRSSAELPSLLTLCAGVNVGMAMLLMLALKVGVPLVAPASEGALWASWLLPASFLAAGIYQTLLNLSVRQRRYLTMSASKVAQTGLFHAGSAASGWLMKAPSATGLVLWDICSRLTGSAVIVGDWLRGLKPSAKSVSLGRMKRLAKAYRRYPVHTLPGSLIGSLVSTAPVFLISSSHGVEAAGHFGMALRTTYMPVGMLLYAVSQVVSADIAQRVRSGDKGAVPVVLRVVRLSLLIGAAPLLLLYAFAEPFTLWALGAEWVETGHMIAVMTPLLLGAILTVPINMALVIKGRTGLQFSWEGCRCIVVLGTLWLSASAGLSAVHIVGAFSLAMLAMALLFVALAVLPSQRTASKPPQPRIEH